MTPTPAWPLDLLAAETEGRIGSLIVQEPINALPKGAQRSPLVRRVEVAPNDPAFEPPSKPIGPVYSATKAALAPSDYGRDKVRMRRVVRSPLPLRIIGLTATQVLLEAGHIVICAGGGGIPVMRHSKGVMKAVGAVIDKDRMAALLAPELKPDAVPLLTDVDAVCRNCGKANQMEMGRTPPCALSALHLAAGSMGPKVAAASDFVRNGNGIARIGRLQDAGALLEGMAATRIPPDPAHSHLATAFTAQSFANIGADQPVSVWRDDGGATI